MKRLCCYAFFSNVLCVFRHSRASTSNLRGIGNKALVCFSSPVLIVWIVFSFVSSPSSFQLPDYSVCVYIIVLSRLCPLLCLFLSAFLFASWLRFVFIICICLNKGLLLVNSVCLHSLHSGSSISAFHDSKFTLFLIRNLCTVSMTFLQSCIKTKLQCLTIK